jgi:tripartite-type tricarboxylate transporter receptor subunit TctC
MQVPAWAQSASAPPWPSRPIRIVVVFPPGGSSDIVARVLAEALTPRLGQRVLVDNRPGAGGTLAAAYVAQQPPDGLTLMLSNTAPIVTSPPLYPQAGYDPVASFTHIAYIGATPLVVVTHNSVPARDLKELAAWARAQRSPPGYGTSGAGSVGHILGEMFVRQAGVTLTHVPYRGSAPMRADLLGGSILLAFDTLPQNVEHMKDGRLHGLAVSAPRRSPMAPAVPTSGEEGFPELVAENWLGLSGPAGLPPAIIARLYAETMAALEMPQVRQRLDEHGIAPEGKTQAEFAAMVAQDVRVIGGAVRAMGITAQ